MHILLPYVKIFGENSTRRIFVPPPKQPFYRLIQDSSNSIKNTQLPAKNGQDLNPSRVQIPTNTQAERIVKMKNNIGNNKNYVNSNNPSVDQITTSTLATRTTGFVANVNQITAIVMAAFIGLTLVCAILLVSFYKMRKEAEKDVMEKEEKIKTLLNDNDDFEKRFEQTDKFQQEETLRYKETANNNYEKKYLPKSKKNKIEVPLLDNQDTDNAGNRLTEGQAQFIKRYQNQNLDAQSNTSHDRPPVENSNKEKRKSRSKKRKSRENRASQLLSQSEELEKMEEQRFSKTNFAHSSSQHSGNLLIQNVKAADSSEKFQIPIKSQLDRQFSNGSTGLINKSLSLSQSQQSHENQISENGTNRPPLYTQTAKTENNDKRYRKSKSKSRERDKSLENRRERESQNDSKNSSVKRRNRSKERSNQRQSSRERSSNNVGETHG